jgi:purine-nucleoside phosphorylase
VTGVYDRAYEAASAIRAAVSELPEVAIVLGSGLGGFAGTIGDSVSLRYADVPHWPVPRIAGHEGRLVIGRLRGHVVAALAGRCHAYEGYGLDVVTCAVRSLAILGVRVLILTNAAGGINTAFRGGTLMVIDDHLNLTGGNPLVGANDERFGPRFPDMTEVYSARLRAIADRAAMLANVDLVHGVYAGVLGPSYETPAEVRYLRAAGADAVGMSTVAEAIAARQMGMEVLGVSCITNMAAGVSLVALDHAEVTAVAERVSGRFQTLLEEIVARI